VRVFATFSAPKAGLVRVWAHSWASRGWSPKLIAEREVREFGTARRAARSRGGGFMSDLRVINFSCTPRKRNKRRTVLVGRPGWETADLVKFPVSATEQEVRDCGRPL
jgi:hypothetical protein